MTIAATIANTALLLTMQPSFSKTQGLIKARLNEGFTVDDFKTVIDKKTEEWINDPKMRNYLRPETLCSNKFEGYLNQKVANSQQAYIDKWRDV